MEYETMDTLTAVLIAEGVEDAGHDMYVEAWQLLHDSGLAYQLQGFFGRTAQNLLAAGIIEE
jgi:hypothetical protein